MKYQSKIVLILLCVLLQAACSNAPVYNDESFSYDSSFKLRTDGDVAMACESARRALLGQGYIIETTGSDGVKARKAYKSESSQNTFIEMNVVCVPETTGSTIFATGVLSTYALKMSSSAASVGVSALGSISLPIGQSADSLVKVSEVTIDDKEFYQRFFASADAILGEMQAGRAPAEPAVVPAAPVAEPLPGPVQAAPAPTPVPVNPATGAPGAASEPVPVPAPPVAPAASPPAQATPVIAPEPISVQQAPAPAPESQPAQEAPAPAPGPDASTRAIEAGPEYTPAEQAPITEPEQTPAHVMESIKSIET
jgi:hypothetical protein